MRHNHGHHIRQVVVVIGKDLTFEGIATYISDITTTATTSIGKDLTFEGIATVFMLFIRLWKAMVIGKDLTFEGIATATLCQYLVLQTQLSEKT